MATSERIGVVGVGRMGANIARRLKDVGYKITAVYDSRPDVAQAVAADVGAEAAKTLSRVAELSDVILTVVSDDNAMRAIFSTSGDSLFNGCKNRLFINCATITPQVHRDVEKLAEERGAQSLEACMASSIPQAREGTLYLMVGGKQPAFERAKPMLEKMSSSLKYIGPAGKAAEVKALVNMVMNINTAGLAEGLGLGDALGIDLNTLREVFAETGAGSRVLVTDGEDIQNRAHECYFSAAHAAKDSGIAVALAKQMDLNLPVAQATKEQFDRMVSSGLGELDKSGIAELTFKSRRARENALA